jgi:AbrB family transcriptional regulator (stage V sporulation protein T)
MQDTGIIRRIDELGRVVVPKELRKSLRIREGDPLEIYTNKDELVLKKYSPISSVGEYAQAVADGIGELTEKVCIITDNDVVVYAFGSKGKDLSGKTISKQMESALKERKSVVVSKKDGGTIIPITASQEIGVENQIIVPIVSAGDCYGSVVVIDFDKSNGFNTSDVRLTKLGASFIAKQFD